MSHLAALSPHSANHERSAAWSSITEHTRLTRFGISFPFLAAPMVGLSHVSFRSLIRHYTPVGLDVLCFTEMLSSRRLPSERLDTTHELACAPGESHFVPQLLCNEERFIAPSLAKLAQQSPWGIDINMGCPVSHTLKHNWGVRLMGDRRYAAEVVQHARRHTSLPLSVKLRGGMEDSIDMPYLVDFTSALCDAGADWLTVHARPRSRKHSGRANWETVGALRQVLPVPVVANGDIQNADDAVKVIREHGADGAMIARALTARPWLMWQIAEDLGYPHAPAAFPGARAPRGDEEGPEYYQACLVLLEFMTRYIKDEPYILKKFVFFVATGVKFFHFGHAFWAKTTKAKSVAAMRTMIEEHMIQSRNPMVSRVDL